MDAISTLIEHSPSIGLFLLLILGGMGLPFPEDATLILCGFLIANDVIRPLHALLVVYVSLLTADTLVYHLGKKYGRRVVTHRRLHRFLSPEKLAELEKRFNRRGAFFILIGRHLIGLRIQIFLVAGIMRMRFMKFILSDAVAALLTVAVMVGIGYAGGNSLQVIRKDISRIEHVAIFVLLVAASVYLVFNYFRARR